MVKMKTNPLKSLDQDGFIPMLVLILLVVGAIIYVVYTRVLHVSK